MPTSETIVTIDIAAQLKTAFATALSGVKQTTPAGVESSVTLRVDPDRTRTALDTDTWPCVGVRVHEAIAHEMVQASRLRDYPVTIVAITDAADDPGQVCLSGMAQAVGNYLLAPSTLTLTAATFRYMALRAEPRRLDAEDGDGSRKQWITWDVLVGVQISTT